MPATLADIQAKYGESVYPLYKDQMHEPYMENKNGEGYQGVVLYDELEGKVICNDCLKQFNFLDPHIRMIHNKSISEYRDQYGYPLSTPLCSKKWSERLAKLGREGFKKRFTQGFGISLGGNNPAAQTNSSITKRIINCKKGMNTMGIKNKYGLCDAQIASRLLIVRDMAGRKTLKDVKNTDLHKYDYNLLSALQRKYGSRKKACKILGIQFLDKKKYIDSELIAKLRNYVIENKSIPSAHNLYKRKLPDLNTYTSYFGSWRRAKMMAGLDQLLAETKTPPRNDLSG